MPNVNRRRVLRLPRRHVIPSPFGRQPFVVWTGLPFVKWLTGHDCLTIYDVVFAAPHSLKASTVAHEGEHVYQWRMYGWRFIPMYLSAGDWGHNHFENWARIAARQNADLYPAIGA